MKHLKYLLVAVGLLFASQADAGTIYVDTAGANSALATNSGSSDGAVTASGTAATVASTTVTLDVGTNLGTVNTSGANQTSINIAGATNSNRTIFWLVAPSPVSGCTGTAVACIVTVDTAPTGVTTNSWSVGGRYLWPSGSTANVVEGALRAGDTLQFNTAPATRTAVYLTGRNSGDTTTGYINIIGKAGTSPRPLLAVTGAAANIATGSQSNYHFQHLELRNTSTGNATGAYTNWWFDDCVFSHPSGGGTANAIAVTNSPVRVTNSEFSGWIGPAIYIPVSSSNQVYVFGSWFHDGTEGIDDATINPNRTILSNVFSNISANAINLTATGNGAGSVIINGNTFYNNGIGLLVATANMPVYFSNNIFYNNGSTANVSWTAGTCDLVGIHSYNVFYASAGTNLTNCTANSTESTSNPLFVAAGSNNFAITNSSPAAGTGWPSAGAALLGSTSTGYQDIGAIQRNASGGTSSGQIIGGGM